ncbi:MAG: sulfatase-like hydrolase/transferase [Verrucomicrobiota bacterium]
MTTLTRVRFFLLGLALLTAALASAHAAAPAARPPNVLLLMTDEHNSRIMGCAGDKVVKTPTLDNLAATGIRFTSAYCQNPICTPSRVALVSGRIPSNIGTFGNGNQQKYPDITTLADLFTKAGYAAHWYGKTHWGDPRFQNNRERGGMQRPDYEEQEAAFSRLPQDSVVSPWPVEQNSDHITANEAVAFLDQVKDKPFFLGVSLIKPHFPFSIQQKYYDMYKGKVGLPHAPAKLIAELPSLAKEEREKYKHAEATNEDILRAREMYYGMVTYADEEMGRVVKKLEELGLRENTIIIYTTDHGEMLGDRGIWYKNTFFEGSAGIPFIWSFPKALPKGQVVRAPAMNMDVLPTLAELCGLPQPSGVEGTSLVPVMRGTDDGAKRIALSENFRGNFAGRMIRTAEWKYFFYTSGEDYLYNLRADSGEETNLVKDPKHQALVADLKQRASAGWVQKQRGIREIVGAGDGEPVPKKVKKKK